MSKGPNPFFSALLFPMLFTLAAWILFYFDTTSNFNLYELGIKPRSITGLVGILLSPLIHGNFNHIFSNTFPLLILSTLLFYYYRVIAIKVFAIIYFLSGLLLWAFAGLLADPASGNSYHIGASGLIYGLAGFLFFSGIIRKNKILFGISLLVTFLYGTIVWGLFPLEFQRAIHFINEKENVSWEGHLFGFICGVLFAFIFRKQGLQKPSYSWELENENDENDGDENPYWMVDENGNPILNSDTSNQEYKSDQENNTTNNLFTFRYSYKPKPPDNGADKMD